MKNQNKAKEEGPARKSGEPSEKSDGEKVNTYSLALDNMGEFRVSVTWLKGTPRRYRVDIDGLHSPAEVSNVEEARQHVAKIIGGMYLDIDLELKGVEDNQALSAQYREDCIDVVSSDLDRAWKCAEAIEAEEVTEEVGKWGYLR